MRGGGLRGVFAFMGDQPTPAGFALELFLGPVFFLSWPALAAWGP